MPDIENCHSVRRRHEKNMVLVTEEKACEEAGLQSMLLELWFF